MKTTSCSRSSFHFDQSVPAITMIMTPTTYAHAGVNIDAADQTVNLIRTLAHNTFNSQVLTGIGSFGAGYSLGNQVLVSSADGVGTKLKVAIETGRHNTIGQDLVNHCVNDIGVQGAQPLFFLDYFATGRLVPGVAAEVIGGVATACRQNRCALIGGETAEMPGIYQGTDYDLAGFIVGSVDRDRMVTGERIQLGDTLIALPSTGLHTNGYSLARQVLRSQWEWNSWVPDLGCTLADEMLKVHQSYWPAIELLLDQNLLGAAHITGGGITENVPRMLKTYQKALINTQSWQVPGVFELIKTIGQVPEADWRRTFNLGVGMILCVPDRGQVAIRHLTQAGIPHWVIGSVEKRIADEPQVQYV